MAPLKFEIRPTRRARELLDRAVEQRATPAESSAVQGDFTEPRIAVGPERRTARPRCSVIAHNSGGADVAPRARSASPKPTIARGKHPNGATRFHELHQPERRL